MVNKKFPKKALDVIRCSCGQGFLRLAEEADYISEGEVFCSNDSNHKYKISGGILKLLSDKDLDPIMAGEMKARDEQSKAYDNRLSSRQIKERKTTLEAVGEISGKKIIEYGCGTGRFTKELLDADFILATDFSFKSLLVLAGSLSGADNVALVQSDITAIETKPKYFDLALSFQVIEHIPTFDLRSKFFQAVKNTLVLDGRFVFSLYHFDLRRKLKKRPAIGFHESGIPYKYFTKKEIKKELQRFFEIDLLKTIDITWPLEARFKLDRLAGEFFSKLGETTPLVKNLGHLVLVAGKRRPDYVHYSWGFLSKHWFWFTKPKDIPDAAMVNFFDYENIDLPGFSKREGLTTIIDLKPSLGEIFSKTREKFIQKQIRRGERNGIAVVHDQNFSGFNNLYKEFRKEYNLPKDRLKPLMDVGDVFSAYYQGELIAGGLFLSNGEYMRAWALSSPKNSKVASREIIGQANRMVIWQAICYAKLIGCDYLDLGGISPESDNPHLRTLAEFKEAFGGERKKNFYYFKIYSPIIRWLMILRGFKNI